MMPNSTVLTLPYPPTANNLFPTGKGGKRFISPEYKVWKQAAGLMLNAQRPRPIPGAISALYEFRKPDNRRRDVTNCEKAVSDLLVTHGVIEDDCLIEDITLRWVYGTPWEARVTVTGIEP